jgi:hypothetical protein
MSSFIASEWSDVVPLKQQDGPNPVSVIKYSEEYQKLMDHFRAILKLQEYSERVLRLTQSILEHNAANYTVWQYRRDCLIKTAANLNDELDFIDTFAEENPKNYQIWNHRRAIVESLGNASRELNFTEIVFKVDGKNYHAWAHRQWALKNYLSSSSSDDDDNECWSKELTYIEDLIKNDIRNNSAWNQRWFVIHNRRNKRIRNPKPQSQAEAEYGSATVSVPVTVDEYNSEREFTWKQIQIVTKNESAWNYLRGISNVCPQLNGDILAHCENIIHNTSASASVNLKTNDDEDEDEVEDEVEDPSFKNSRQGNTFALALAADLWELNGSIECIEKALFAYEMLKQCDGIRVKVWNSRIAEIEAMANANGNAK